MNTAYHFPLCCTNITNRKIKTIRNEHVGFIRNLMIDTQTGKVIYVIIELKKHLGNPIKKFFATPWDAFNFNTKERDAVLLNITKEKLENAPSFEEDEWPIGLQQEFIHKVNYYYKVEGDVII